MESGRSFGYCFVSFFFLTLTDVLNGPLKLVRFTLIESNYYHLGDWSPEKDYC